MLRIKIVLFSFKQVNSVLVSFQLHLRRVLFNTVAAMSESGEAGRIVTHQEITTESEDEDSDGSTDFDPEEIEKEIMGVKSMLRRHCGRHKVRRRIERFHSRGLQLCKLIGTK